MAAKPTVTASPRSVHANTSTEITVTADPGGTDLASVTVVQVTDPGTLQQIAVPFAHVDQWRVKFPTPYLSAVGASPVIITGGYTGGPAVYPNLLSVIAAPTPGAPCIRRAWLTLDGAIQPLEDHAAGYACPELDLGYPDVRAVVNNRPDQNGIDDRTQYFGARAVTANIVALASAGAQVDAVATAFAPYMVPSARPVLHYVLDRPGAGERTLTLRASGYSWPLKGGAKRDIQLAWIAADPIARDPTTKSATAWAGTAAQNGRGYPLTFNRSYPTGTMPPTYGYIVSNGDVPVRPMLRIYGPITAPAVTLAGYRVATAFGFRIDPGHFADIDTAARTMYLDGDPTRPAMSSINWQTTTWPVLPAGGVQNLLALTGTSTSQVSQVVATWNDGYLS